MNRSGIFFTLFTAIFISTGSLKAQQQADKGFNSISEAELRDHIFFLASDYLNGRVSATPEYDIAAQYVATQFSAAGLLHPEYPGDSTSGYMQGVPFMRTIYSNQLHWTLTSHGTEKKLTHKEDFKILLGNQLNHDKLQLVYVGYGIDEPDHKWTDLKDLDLTGKIAVCLAGAPLKNGKPVLPKKIHEKYAGRWGAYSKALGGLGNKGVAAVIMIDPDGSAGMPFNLTPSSFATEKTVFKGDRGSSRPGSRPSMYLAKPGFLDLILPAKDANPSTDQDNTLSNYKPRMLEDTYLDCRIETLKEEMVYSNNVIGIVPGTDSVLRNEYIVVGGHLDHVAPQKGETCNGADDNASGSAGVIEIAEAIALNPCKRTIVFVTYTGEEMGLLGSSYFLNSGIIPKEQIKFNLNMDMIGRTGRGNETTRAHYVVTDKKYLSALTAFIREINNGITDFPILFDDDEHSPGGSDHMTFMKEGIPAFFFFSGLHEDLHKPGDDPGKIDYPKAASICKLGYLIVQQLGNMDAVPAFL